MNIKATFTLATLALVLTACGGGGSDSDVNSSFKSEITQNGQTYVCHSQKAADACSSLTNKDCSACDSKSTTPDTSTTANITTECTKTSATQYQVSQAGCLVNMTSGVQTAVCSGTTTLKLLSGSGLTKEKVLSQGSSFSGSNLTLNGVSLKCA